jgi:ubiquinone/menaquinone biosynthesis C-methylase UbiE/DNA-binding transcriptional ArsR family regulator
MNDDAGQAVLTHLSTLADGLRVRMLLVLEARELPVSEICEVLQLPQSTVSRHLKTLADDGWVSSRREGTSRFYSLVTDELCEPSRSLWAVVRRQTVATGEARRDAERLRQVVEARRAKSQAFFSTAAGQWDRLRDELFGQTVHLQGLLGLIDERWTIADLGCGTGRMTETLAPFVARVIAVDGSEEMLAAARARLGAYSNVDIRHGTLEAVPLAAASVDAAYIGLVLHHVPDPGKVLVEAVRLLKPGGRLLITDMVAHDRDEYRQQMGHVWLGFSEQQVTRYLQAAGLTNPRVTPLPPDPRAKGPALFVATARRAERQSHGHIDETTSVEVETRAESANGRRPPNPQPLPPDTGGEGE